MTRAEIGVFHLLFITLIGLGWVVLSDTSVSVFAPLRLQKGACLGDRSHLVEVTELQEHGYMGRYASYIALGVCAGEENFHLLLLPFM